MNISLSFILSVALLASSSLEALLPLWGRELTLLAALILGTGLLAEQIYFRRNFWPLEPLSPILRLTTGWEGSSSAVLLGLLAFPQLSVSSVSSFATAGNGDWQKWAFVILYQSCLCRVLWSCGQRHNSLRPIWLCGLGTASFNAAALLLRASGLGPAITQVPAELWLLPFFSLANAWLCQRYYSLTRQLAAEQQRNHDLSRSASDLAKSNVHVLNRALLHSAEIRQEERLEVAREIHDVLGFTLSAGLISTEVLLAELRNDEQIRPALRLQLDKQLNEQQDRVRNAIHQVRQAVSKLRSRSGSLRFARDWELLMDIFSETTHVAVRHSIPPILRQLKNPAIGKLIYRIIQESLTNALRHGQASMVDVSMLKEEQWILLRISDNGKGCESAAIGNGLSGMMERLDLVNGRMAWQSEPDKGFDLGVEIPCSGHDFLEASQ